MADDGARALENRIRRLEAEKAISERLHSYGHCIDYGDVDEWLDCFTEDGAFDVRRAQPAGATHKGRAELGRFVRAHTHAPQHWHKHLVLDPLIDVDGDRASATSYFLRVDLIGDRPTLRTFGRYRDQLRLCTDGTWRFTLRIVEVEGRLLPEKEEN